LNNIEDPQTALNRAIDEHVAEHDDAEALLIIFYTGHGRLRWHDKRFQLYAGPHSHRRGRHEATAFWDEAEVQLLGRGIKSDVLAIFDCCFAGAAQKGFAEEERVYELLAACPSHETTAAPGPTSFTNILIDCMEKLLSDSGGCGFTTTKLQERLLQHPSRSARSHPVLSDQLYKHERPVVRHIRLAPLGKRTRIGLAASRKRKRSKSSEPEEIRLPSLPRDDIAVLIVLWDCSDQSHHESFAQTVGHRLSSDYLEVFANIYSRR
jgi:hypothetical protein